MSGLKGRAKEIFLNALNQTGDWESFIAGACNGDEALLQRVQALLKAHQEAGEFLPPSNLDATMDTGKVLPTPNVEGTIDSGGPVPVEMTRTQAAAEPKSSSQIGPYKLLEEIGEGGMGTVWVAQQSKPINRKVAIKLIKAGMDSQQVLARFEAERQALAMMDHPNIARVVDAGMTEQGRPYFAMEYVKGVPLTEYCDQAKLSVKDRLELFLPICNAVQHAHQKGIIHRDLKPSNILICLYDGKPVPKVIDFGLAKAMHQSLTDRTLHTHHGMMIGTPLYMSPEQAESNNLDIDTRTDIYSLGVILYELLTGSTPLEKAQLKEAVFLEVLRLIKEVEPPKPSMRLSGSESLPSVAAQRSVEPSHLARSVTGDLDWVVMKALEKERDRRYETANGLSEDIRRHLSDEPVSASPPSSRYRMRKFVKRNKGPVLAASLLLVSLIAGIGGTTWGLAESNRQSAQKDIALRAETEARKESERQTNLAIQAREKEALANAKAQQRATQLERGNEIITGIFTDLDILRVKKDSEPVEPLEAVLAKRLVKAAEQLEGDSLGDPLVVAKLQDRLGESLHSLGFFPEAVELHEKSLATRAAALGPEHFDVLESMHNLVLAYKDSGQLNKALTLAEQTVELSKTKLGSEHTDTLTTMSILALAYKDTGQLDKAITLQVELLRVRTATLGPEHLLTVTNMNNLATTYLATGQLDKALPLFEQALPLVTAVRGPEHADTLNAMNNLGTTYIDLRQLDKALPLLKQTLELRRAALGTDHPDTLFSMNNLAGAYMTAGQLDEALPLSEQTLRIFKAKFGPEHPNTLTSMNTLAGVYKAAGQQDKALPILKQVFQLRKDTLGPQHPDTLKSMSKLASTYLDASQPVKALPLFEQLLQLEKARYGPEHFTVLSVMNNLASTYKYAGQVDKALPLMEQTRKLMEAKFGPEHPNTLICTNNLAKTYQAAGQMDMALPLMEKTVELFKAKFGPEDPNTISSMNSLAQVYSDAGRPEEAMETAKEQLLLSRKVLPPNSLKLAEQLASYGLLNLETKAYAEAETAGRECLVIREKDMADHWLLFNTYSLLGGSLLGQQKYEEAEPLLLKGYQGMKEREQAIPGPTPLRLTEAIERLVRLYQATDNEEQSAKWQAELEKRHPDKTPAEQESGK